MALTLERIREIVGNEGYRLVEDRLGSDRDSDAPRAQVAEARSSRIEVLQRTYGKTVGSHESSVTSSDAGSRATRGSSTPGTGAIVTVEPSHGHGRRKAIVLSEDGEILGEQG